MVVIQSRLASTRLPAKALLPVAGRAAVVLCAQRAANTGLAVTVATSDEPDDDAIADALAQAGINCFRGPLEDVLLRFVLATDGLAESAPVVRLTADNLFPDGEFVETLLKAFAQSGLDYLGTRWPQDGLPYGMSAEVFSAGLLRTASREARQQPDREHVTPWMRRGGNAGAYRYPASKPHWPRLRCTLDTYDDYRLVRDTFVGCSDPVHTPWTDLVGKLASLTPGGTEPRCPFREGPDGRIHSVLTLGTAQFGSRYGIANQTGEPDDSQIGQMLLEAADAGITCIDTASAYGRAEERIGNLLPARASDSVRIVTKLDVLTGLSPDASVGEVTSRVDSSVYKSLYRLKRRSLDTLLLHRWAHHDGWDSAAWARLVEMKHHGLIGTLGASVASPAEALEALADPEVDHVQCPVNILDGRWRDPEFLAAVRRRPRVIFHARSVFLQGMLLLPPENWVRPSEVAPAWLCDILDGLTKSLGRIDRADLCAAYVRSLPWVTSLVVGMETVGQLRANLKLARTPDLSATQLEAIAGAIPPLPESLLNPARWQVAHA